MKRPVELSKLIKYLVENYYRIEVSSNVGVCESRYPTQVRVYNESGKEEWDAVFHKYCYGYKHGLLEVQGSIVKNREDGIEGWLSADDIIGRLEENPS